MHTFRKGLMVLLSLLLLVAALSLSGAAQTNEEEVPEPLFHWGFEEDEVDGDFIFNQIDVEDSSGFAEMKENATVVDDEHKGSVLHLPGNGWLTLPSNLYEEVNDELTIAVWVNVDSNASNFSRLFASTITEKHLHFQGETGSWSDPEFGFVAGGTTGYEQLIQIGTSPGGAANYRAAIMWEEQITRDTWQHVTITLKDDGEYIVYLDGQSIKIGGMDGNASNDDATLEGAVQRFFDRDFLDALLFNDFGRSIYTSDNDTIGYFDDLQIYNKALTPEQVRANIDSEFNATLKSITIGDDKMTDVKSKDIRYETTQGVVGLEDIQVETTNPDAVVEIEQQNFLSYAITVTSPNELVQTTYTLAFYNPDLGAIASFNMTETNGEIMHGASGFLYGVSEPNVPTIDLLEPLKPQSVEQKPPNGLQHPTGDGLRVADTYLEAGTKWIQLAVQDMYLEWPYEYEGLDHYEELVRETVRTTKEHKHSDKFVYVIFNEPNGIWFSGNLGEDGFLSAWKRIYNVVKEEDPDAKIAGPNFYHYDHNFHEQFLAYTVEHDVLPDQFTWHELSGAGSLSNWYDHVAHYRGLEEQYGIELPIVINEYVGWDDNGSPGRLVPWLSRVENSKVYAGLAYWHSANSLNELAADANKPNGAWWLYKWYGDMTGETVTTETYNAEIEGMYGLASIDDERGKAYTIFGGEDGPITATMIDLADTETFKDASSAHVKLYRTKYTGFMGSHEVPRVEYEGNLPLVDGNLYITVPDSDSMDAFHAIVTPATDDTITDFQDYDRVWTKTYEAEDAQLNGARVEVSGWGAASNDNRFVRGLNSPDRNVEFTVDVPKDGRYKLEVFYGNGAPFTNGQNRAQGELAEQLLKLNGEDYDVLTYDSTIDINKFASKKLYLDLNKGTNTLQFSYHDGMEASLDKIDLTYVGQMGEEAPKVYQYEAEEASYTDGFTFSQTKDQFSSAGYIQGSGENQYTVVVEDNGYYDLEIGYASDSNQAVQVEKRIVNYASDATADADLTTEWSPIARYDVEQSSDFTSVSGMKVYLTAGANALKITAENDISLDYLTLTYDPELTASERIVVEAEDGELFGDARVTENEHVSGGKLVTDIGVSEENGLTLTVNVDEAGAYKLSMDYINNEPAPVMYTDRHPDGYIHPYNKDLVERYAQVVVNDQTPQTVYFINTLSWDSVRNHVIDIELEAGENTITLYNDNSYRFNDVIQYAPHFDKFEIAKASISSIDKTELGNVIAIAEELEEEDYTSLSWENVIDALLHAKSVFENGSATQAEIDAAKEALEESLEGLVFSTTGLHKIIDQAEAAGDLSEPLLPQLRNRLNQAEHHDENGRIKQAIKQLSDFVKHINNQALAKHVEEETKARLIEEVEKLMMEWENL
ncbi:FIMAH domain-containing protein [Evansella cellulosilytica]|uniref:CBM6 domain-containing protein n=1 Tax=Evansella cellulosilytica (strain ATCC 21833 / DSM 2522 / FERM P-1141 / JCM 9156 / N-4) TaxID=649639 RepID=E6TQZ6_EVAC2|nr:LamG-like jellyroll fold domain-containing protein [Evansella cellulosilytica]ADU29372.1 hypothetical protein Bcell_1102 [Evansella cellulosilytica DSM 2522]